MTNAISAPGMPWLIQEVIDWLEHHLRGKQLHVLETGCGGSTVFFAERAAFVLSYENDWAYWRKTEDEIFKRELRNVLIRLRPDYNFNGLFYFDEDVIQQTDLVLIDGRGRVRSVMDAFPVLRPGGWILLDDSHREQYVPATKMLDAACPTRIMFQSGEDETKAWRKP